MSKIENGGLDQYGAGSFEQQQCGTAGVERVNETLWKFLPFNSYRSQAEFSGMVNMHHAVEVLPEQRNQRNISVAYCSSYRLCQCGQLICRNAFSDVLWSLRMHFKWKVKLVKLFLTFGPPGTCTTDSACVGQ